MNSYEHTLITPGNMSENQNQKIFDKYKDIIAKNSGKIIKTEEWGLRILAHKIKKNKKGFYFHIKLEGNGKTIEELERAENIDDSLIRFLTVKVKKHDLKTNFFDKEEVYKKFGKKWKEAKEVMQKEKTVESMQN